MVGYETEDKAYCMELTFNYGVQSYTPGTGLKEFGICVPSVDEALAAARKLGFSVEEQGVIVGPDQYRYRPLPTPEGRVERFVYVLCQSGNLQRSVDFYCNTLGFAAAEVPTVPGLPSTGKLGAVSYTSSSHPHGFEPVTLVFHDDGSEVKIQPWEGRHAFALDAAEVCEIHKRMKADMPKSIMHEGDDGPISLQEKLGTLFIFIAKDPDGYELCLVSRETMLPAAVDAVVNYDSKLLDWSTRDTRIAAIAKAGVEIEEIIAKNKVAVFSKEWCPFCKRAKGFFADIEADIFVKELEDEGRTPIAENPNKAFEQYLAGKTNQGTSVPKVFIGGQFIGGGDDTKALFESGQLLKKCVAVGAAVEPDRSQDTGGVHYFINGRAVSQADHDGYEL